MRNFWKKFRTLWKNALFCVQIFIALFVSNQRKKIFNMATFTFRVGDYIFFICYLKNHMTLFWDFWSKLFGNIWKIFLISGSKFFKLIFLEFSAENIRNAYFHYIQTCLRFVFSLLFILWIIIFWIKIRFARNLALIKNLKKIISPRLAHLISRPVDHFKFISFNSRKKIFLLMC
jgi:hypothetical protein